MGGGKMLQWLKGKLVGPQNQTISAIIVLGRVPVGERLFHAELRRREPALGRPFTTAETFIQFRDNDDSRFDLRRRQLRVVVHENPYARIPLSADMFRGPYDQRYGERDGRIQELFRGDAFAALPD